jgi:hypothetical protein
LSAPERELYDELTHALKVEYREHLVGNQTVLPLITLQRELCSSPQALLPTLEMADWLGPLQADLVQLAGTVALTSKMRAVIELIRTIKGQVLVFTEHRATQRMIGQ